MKDIITLTGLTKYYGKIRGIEDLSFSIREGEIFGFIGPNGAGKSTTIRTLLNLIHPTRGESRIFGMDPRKEYWKIARDVGYIPAEIYYYENMKVRDLLAYSASFYPVDCRKRREELLELLELDPNRHIRDLSLGNRKKVGILQGLQHQPELLILDEPTSGLDPLMQNRFFQLIQEENARGATVLFSSHILSEVQRLSHRVGILKDGGLIRLEEMASLRKDTYKKVRLEGLSLSREALKSLSGVRNLEDPEGAGTLLTFLYQGEVPPLLEALQGMALTDLLISEPDLEEIFLHYYDGEGQV